MGTDDQALTCIVCVWNTAANVSYTKLKWIENNGVLGYIGEPLAGQTGPCEGVGDDGVIEERSAIRLLALDAELSWLVVMYYFFFQTLYCY